MFFSQNLVYLSLNHGNNIWWILPIQYTVSNKDDEVSCNIKLVDIVVVWWLKLLLSPQKWLQSLTQSYNTMWSNVGKIVKKNKKGIEFTALHLTVMKHILYSRWVKVYNIV